MYLFLRSQNELQHVQMQLGVAGSKYHQVLSIKKEISRLLRAVFFLLLLFLAMDSHHLFKCKGTFVGHAVSVLCDLILGYKG